MTNIQQHKIVVLKFGHSILKTETDIPKIIAETYLYVRAGYKVLVVVSAIGNSTDILSRQAENIFPDGIADAPDESIAALLATGEISSGALVSIGFNQVGISAANLNHAVIKTDDNILDATPLELDLDTINNAFTKHAVLILPGFIGVNAENKTTLLGRGGSDFSAIFSANCLNASQCVLYKDSNGIVEDITVALPTQKIYSHITYNDCLAIAYPVIQYKATQYAREHKQKIYIKNIFSQSQTIVGAHETVVAKKVTPPRKTKILLLGLGTVGLGVFHKLIKNNKFFEIVGIGVKHLDKHARHCIGKEILSDNIDELLSKDYDVLVELVGGALSKKIIIEALKKKRHVVTANKLVISESWRELHDLALVNNAYLKYSAAVAGVIPVLETITDLNKNVCAIHEVSGVLNGTSNFVLGLVDNGIALQQAIKIAKEKGYAESDPTLDINGMDAFHKIKIISLLAFGQAPDKVEIEGIESVKHYNEDKGHCLKLIATAKLVDNNVLASVKLVRVAIDNPFASVCGADNLVVIKIKDKKDITLSGKGAGRWPTALAVYADILDLTLDKKRV